MSYQVIARKWRPKSFEELVGQDHISVTLLNALKNGRLPQALLFTGPRGTGKTSSARILAKSLRCPNAKDFVPCNVCPSCEDIAQGRSLDVIEIDGASNNGVDAVRELRDTVGYMPSSGRYKVYIIDEVHMLSTSAFNALLKTLEEPPPHVVFIMATTEAQKIPNTILSRCQRFDFRRIPSRQIAAHLELICQADGVASEAEALWLIARQADGSMRDSQSLLDQVITYCEGQVTLAKVIDVLGLTDRSLLLEALGALVHREPEKILDVIEKIFRAGYDPKIFAQDLLEELRNALMVRLCKADPARIVDLPDTEIQALADLTTPLSDEDIHFLFDMALKGANDLLRSQDPRVVLEMMLLRMAAAPRLVHLSHLLHAPAVTGATLTTAAPTIAYAQASAAPPRAAPNAAKTTGAAKAVAKPSTPAQANRPPASAPASSPAPATGAQNGESPSGDPWFKFVARVKEANGFLGAMLENTHITESKEDLLVVGVPQKMSFLFDKLKDPENVRRIEQFLESFWNKRCKVEIRLGDAKTEVVTPKVVAEKKQQEQKQSLEQAVERHPLVRSAQDVFKTQIKSIKERP
ncbi:MAG: DNA polymerase III subunit gamma/tau [Bdellovibrionaceae bacterium]|nr:DNA polymerase III subunit gamma/tau [Pseudobdellovibrionaceae bacterium]